jgi:hypothetical protein
VEHDSVQLQPADLLGRDVLNDHRLVLDGPQLRLEID